MFVWPSATAIAQVGVQKSRVSNRREVEFTLNVTVVDLDEWAAFRAERPQYPERPSPNELLPGVGWQSRLGILVSGIDKWWTVTAEGPWQPVADEVVEAISTYVVPELEQRA
jgi:hypothetical protein